MYKALPYGNSHIQKYEVCAYTSNLTMLCPLQFSVHWFSEGSVPFHLCQCQTTCIGTLTYNRLSFSNSTFQIEFRILQKSSSESLIY